jgi:hypothetical protein
MSSALSSSSSSFSSSSLGDRETIFNSFRPDSSSLSYDEFGDSTQEDLNGLKTEWKLSFEYKGILQSIWANHPKRQQGIKILLTHNKNKMLPSF